MSAPDAAETAWERHGSGPPVVLIHGFGLNRAMWQWQLPALVPHFTVLTYDLPGHGESAPPAGTPSLAMFSPPAARPHGPLRHRAGGPSWASRSAA